MNTLMLNVQTMPYALGQPVDRATDARRAVIQGRDGLSRFIPFDIWLGMKHRSQHEIKMYHTVITEILVSVELAQRQLWSDRSLRRASNGKATQ